MAAFPVFFDTCVLYGATLNDLFLRLAEEGAHRLLWSDRVLTDLERNLSDRVGADAARRRVGAMRRAFPEAMVDGFARLEDEFLLDQLGLYPAVVERCLDDLTDAYEDPPQTLDQILDRLALDVPKFASMLRLL